ncbi:hypothetical protein GE21DRAFT_1341873 [Neurospora crassa]|nr:hypothetical protein GE21DRAFT_1341873 [Neurospora crassa]
MRPQSLPPDTSTTQTSPMIPQSHGPREPQPCYVVPQPPTPPPDNDDPSPQASSDWHLQLLKEELRKSVMLRLKRINGVVDDPFSQHIVNSDRNHTATDPDGTSENSGTFTGSSNHTPTTTHDQPQDQRHITQGQVSDKDREPRYRVHVVTLPKLTVVGLVLVSWVMSAIIGGVGALGWTFWHSQVRREMFAEVAAGRGSEALKVMGRGLMGVGAAVGKAVWEHFKWNLGLYALFVLSLIEFLGTVGVAIAESHWYQAQVRPTCYCYTCRIERARPIKRETGVSPAELNVRVGTSDPGDDWE